MRKAHYLGIIAGVIGLDVATKQWVLHALKLGKTEAIMPGLNMTHAHNTGAAFSFLAHADGWQQGFFVGIAVVVSIWFAAWLWRAPTHQRWTCLGLSLVIAGAIGNMIDRLYYGYVIDFIDVYVKTYHWPAFNVADSAICVGAACLLIAMVREQ